jgi:hemoglobin/transferrin/lactoferrin receptor protein
MKKNLFYLIVVLPIFGWGQTLKDTIVTELNEVVVSIKVPKNYEKLPNQIEVITAKQIDFQNFQSTAEVLSNSGSLFVQKSQQGGGSPVIRGFEASRVLLIVDGVRMNNLIFRAGHLQNIITVDESILDNIGIFYGPSSTLFGSDALGGTVAMTTKRAKFLSEVKNKYTGGISTRYSSSNEEKSVSFNLNYATSNFASFSSLAYNDFGDLKMGKTKNHNGDFFGERPFYVATIGGVDQLMVNDDKYVQKKSGFKQYNFLQKLAFKTNSGSEHGLNFQFSTSSNVPRYDRLTDPSSSTVLRNAEWYYGPQQRVLAIYSIAKSNAFLGSDMKVNFAYQNAQESRHNRRFGNYNLQHRKENVNMYSASLDLTKKGSNSDFFYGFETYFETLKSSAYAKNINTGVQTVLDTRYPNGDNNMMRNDFYVSFNHTFSEKTFWNTGARVGITTLRSTIANNTFFSLPFNSISQGNLTYSGAIGIVHNPSNNVMLKANVSSGFRAPNIDDLAKIFESVPGTLIVPNEDLKPEKTVTLDLGFVLKSDSKRFKIENTYFYTRLYDAIVMASSRFNGLSTIIYDGAPSAVFANQNKRKAFITGLSTNVIVAVLNHLHFNANFNYTLGKVVENGNQSPLDHISPYFGKIGFLFTQKSITLETYILYNGKKALSDYSSSGEDNLVYAPATGMPAWETYNFKAGFTVIESATIFAGVENIVDTQYRTFSSGINAPGRNIYAGLKYTF